MDAQPSSNGAQQISLFNFSASPRAAHQSLFSIPPPKHVSNHAQQSDHSISFPVVDQGTPQRPDFENSSSHPSNSLATPPQHNSNFNHGSSSLIPPKAPSSHKVLPLAARENVFSPSPFKVIPIGLNQSISQDQLVSNSVNSNFGSQYSIEPQQSASKPEISSANLMSPPSSIGIKPILFRRPDHVDQLDINQFQVAKQLDFGQANSNENFPSMIQRTPNAQKRNHSDIIETPIAVNSPSRVIQKIPSPKRHKSSEISPIQLPTPSFPQVPMLNSSINHSENLSKLSITNASPMHTSMGPGNQLQNQMLFAPPTGPAHPRDFKASIETSDSMMITQSKNQQMVPIHNKSQHPNMELATFNPAPHHLNEAYYSTYNASLTAQALLEDTEQDMIKAEPMREVFLAETGKLASVMEELVSEAAETSDTITQLCLNLQLANNEALLMNASLMADERFAKLENYFARAIIEE